LAKELMKFTCDNCNKENWICEEPSTFGNKNVPVIVYCCECGYVKGFADRVEQDDKAESCCICLPFEGEERKQTRGPKTVAGKTKWGQATGGKDLDKDEYMAKYGRNPFHDWCERHPNDPICKNDGTGVSYKERCKNRGRPIDPIKPRRDEKRPSLKK
jgi:hypothetical protein